MTPQLHVLVCTDCTMRALDWGWVRVALCPITVPWKLDCSFPGRFSGHSAPPHQWGVVTPSPPSWGAGLSTQLSLLHSQPSALSLGPCSALSLLSAPASSGTCVVRQAGSSTLLLRAVPVCGVGRDAGPVPASPTMWVQQAACGVGLGCCPPPDGAGRGRRQGGEMRQKCTLRPGGAALVLGTPLGADGCRKEDKSRGNAKQRPATLDQGLQEATAGWGLQSRCPAHGVLWLCGPR